MGIRTYWSPGSPACAEIPLPFNGSVEFPEGEVEPEGCRLEESCITKEAVRKLHEALRSFLGQVTLRDLTWNTISLKVDLPVADHRYGRLPVMAH